MCIRDSPRRRRVHPSLSDPRAARRFPPHSTLRPLRQCQSGRQYRTGPPASRRTRPSPVERRERRHRKSSRRPRVEHLPLLRRAYDHHRDLPARLPAAAVAHPIEPARQLMTSTLLLPSHIATPVPGRYHTGDGYSPPTAAVSAAFDRQNAGRSLRDHRSDPARGDQSQRRDDYSAVGPRSKPKDAGIHRR